MSIVARSVEETVRELQRTLYRAAKAEPGRRFHALYDKVHRRDVVERAWGQVRRNRGAAGIDGITLAEVERHGGGPIAGRTGRGAEGGELSGTAEPPGVDSQARTGGAGR